MKVVVHDTPETAAAGVATRIIKLAGDRSTPRYSIGLAGGSTPAATYRLLATSNLDFSAIDFWLSDERWFPHDHDRSNGRAALDAFAGAEGFTLVRPEWSPLLTPRQSAIVYETEIRRFGHGGRLDLIYLGIGPDGHTASLFPDTEALNETERWFVDNMVPGQDEMRLTATYPLIHSSRNVILHATGPGKAEAVRDSLAGKLPAGMIGEGKAEVEWHLDVAAASLL